MFKPLLVPTQVRSIIRKPKTTKREIAMKSRFAISKTPTKLSKQTTGKKFTTFLKGHVDDELKGFLSLTKINGKSYGEHDFFHVCIDMDRLKHLRTEKIKNGKSYIYLTTDSSRHWLIAISVYGDSCLGPIVYGYLEARLLRLCPWKKHHISRRHLKG